MVQIGATKHENPSWPRIGLIVTREKFGKMGFVEYCCTKSEYKWGKIKKM